MQKKCDKRTEMFMEFFAKEFGVKFHDVDTGEVIGIDGQGELGVIDDGEEEHGQ